MPTLSQALLGVGVKEISAEGTMDLLVVRGCVILELVVKTI